MSDFVMLCLKPLPSHSNSSNSFTLHPLKLQAYSVLFSQISSLLSDITINSELLIKKEKYIHQLNNNNLKWLKLLKRYVFASFIVKTSDIT